MRAAKQRASKRVVHGLWWVDEAPENKVAGTLRYGFSGIELELSSDPLFGKDDNFAAQHEHWTKRPNTIIGLSDNGRDKFTIVDALPLRVGPTLRFFANHALRGAHLVDTSSREFTFISFEVEQLEAWAGPLIEKHTQQEDSGRFDSKTLFCFDTEKAKYEVRWWSFPFFKAREFGNALTCSVVATFFAKVDLSEALDELSKLFVSLMTIFAGERILPRSVAVALTPDSQPWKLSLLGETSSGETFPITICSFRFTAWARKPQVFFRHGTRNGLNCSRLWPCSYPHVRSRFPA